MTRVTAENAPDVIYGSTSAGLLIGRAWNLFKRNFKASILLMLVPVLFQTTASILYGIPAALPALTLPQPGQLAVTGLSFLAAFGVGVIGWFVGMLCYSALVRIYYSALTRNEPIGLRESLGFVRQFAPALLLFFLCLFVVYIGFVMVDALIAAFGVMIGMILLPFILGGKSSLFILAVTVFLLVVWGFLVLSVVIGLMSVQLFFSLFPFMALATADSPGDWWRKIRHAWRLLWANLPRAALYGALLVLFCFLFALVSNVPVGAWAVFEMRRIGLGPEFARGGMPLYINTIVNLWANLSNMVLLPFLFGAVTLFWYDCQVRKDGLDLRLWLNRLRLQRGKGQPGLRENV